MAKPHTRPSRDFRITSLGSEIEIEHRHAVAGFDPISRAVLARRYFQFIDFLQRNQMTTRMVCARIEDLDDSAELRNSDLADDGFSFVRKYHGRWLDRARKDRGETAEEKFLVKWLSEFRA